MTVSLKHPMMVEDEIMPEGTQGETFPIDESLYERVPELEAVNKNGQFIWFEIEGYEPILVTKSQLVFD